MSKKLPTLPPPPSFSTAPDIFQVIPPAPSFKSAPNVEDLLDQNEDTRKQSREKKESHKSKRRQERSNSPSHQRSHRHSRKRSRSPSPSRHRSRSRSPHQAKHSRRSRSPSNRKRRSKRSNYSRSPEERHGRSRSPKRSKMKTSSRTASPPQSGKLDSGLSFYVDTVGDPNNLIYGPNTYSVPVYRRGGYGKVLGISDSLKIDAASAKGGKYLELVKPKKPAISRGFDLLNLTDENRTLITPIKDDDFTFSSQAGFVDLAATLDDHKKDEETGLISSGVDYRSIEGSASDKKNNLGQQQQQQQTKDDFEEYVRQRTIRYNKELAEDPSNVQNWLDFIDFQDEISKGLDSGTDSKRKSRSAKTTLGEVKISIFRKALEKNPVNEDLWLAYLRCGGEVWDTLTLLENWDKALERIPNSIRLWSDYINLRQTNFSSFSFDDCVKVFEDCLGTLHQISIRLQAAMKHDDDQLEERENIESLMVYVVLRLCLFMKQAGYQERAYATIQALVEFCLFQPLAYRMSPSSTLSRQVSDFSKFWDSEVPRFGEANAQGWNSYYAKVSNEQEIEILEGKQSEIDDELYEVDTILDWLNQEQQQQRRHILPRRMNDKEQISIDDDPFRVVLSEDVASILFNITTTGARKSLIYSIFVFLGLPYSPPGIGTNTHFSTDTFTHNDLQLGGFWPVVEQQQHQIGYVDGVPMKQVQRNDQNPFDLPLSYPVGVEELFARGDYWFTCFGKRYLTNDEDIMFTRNVFDQILKIEKTDDHLAVCYLSFESSYGHKGGRNLAKKLLNDQRTNIKLWNAYAQMEKGYGRQDEARKVYQLALAAAKDFTDDDRLLVPLLYRMYAQLEMEYGQPHEALCILLGMATEGRTEKPLSPSSQADINSAKEFFSRISTLTRHYLTQQNNDIQTTIAYESLVCHALFEYLVNGVDGASQVYQQIFDYLSENHIDRGFISEKIRVSHVELLYHHAIRNNSGYQPSKLRHATKHGLALFPNNTILLGLFIWNESKTWIYNRVQGLFATSLASDPNIILWLVYVYVHLHRNQPYDVNLVRTLFEEALEHPRTKSSILLWKLYIQHEVGLGNTEKARELLYRSVRECPWSKDLYLFGFQKLGSTMTTKELLDLTSLMMEKDIRTRLMIDQDELFELD
ncbi:NRDE-2, necessary for RNA interference-domain-containing protein [Chlamydoabsidia padenii]|nr:NRDE-2, necessary for RNA interference-domain-containing protein [Chlamydoabsidia padenii]